MAGAVVARSLSGDPARSFRQSTSGLPAARFSVRASTNSRSDSRFEIAARGSLTGSVAARRTSARSARRQTVRATCASAAARVPPGRMNSLSGAEVGVEALDGVLEPLDVRVA